MGTMFLDSWPIADAEWSEKVTSPCGPKRHFAAPNNNVAIGVTTDIGHELRRSYAQQALMPMGVGEQSNDLIVGGDQNEPPK
jgi:hypothetical protein